MNGFIGTFRQHVGGGVALSLVCVVALALFACRLSGAAPADEAADAGLRLRDFLGRTWRNESVSFALPEADLERAQKGYALLGPDGKAVTYQLVPGAGDAPPTVEFLTNLDPFEERVYRFGDKPQQVQTDLKVEETATSIRLSNALTGVSVLKALKDGLGPIESVRLNSGKWVGGSRIEGEVTAYKTELTARGPVFAEVACTAKLGEKGTWEVRFRVEAGEPVVLVDERFQAGGKSAFVVSLGRGLSPDHLLYRYGKGMPGAANAVGKLEAWKIAPREKAPAFVLVPWLPWWEGQRENTWFGLFREDGTDLLSVGAREPSVWLTPWQRAAGKRMPRIRVTLEGEDLAMRLPLDGGERKWMLAALDKDESTTILKEKNLRRAPLPQQYLVKHGDFPLDRVKDYVYEWEADVENHPRLFITKEGVDEYRKTFQPNPPTLEGYRAGRLHSHNLDGPIAYYLGTDDAALGKRLTDTAVSWVQNSVNMYLHQDSLVTLGFAPHHQTQVLVSMNLTDAILSSKHLTPQMRARVLGQIAFLGYTVNRDDYWSPQRGYSANPNMTSTVAAYQAVIAGIIPKHPMAKTWMDRAMAELKDNQLDTWSDDNGGWLEAPHYAMVSYDYMLGCFLMAHNAGFNDYLYDPKMKKVIEWFGKISTPPDSRLGGRRHKPPIGNTYIGEPCGEFAQVAYLWREKDPEFASVMQWMFRQHGSYASPGIGGFYPTLAGYRTIMSDPNIAPKAPAWKSELFPETGVILRNKYPCDRETQLHMIAGRNHAHYDRDSGSITMWGKGRILADDFGYTGYGIGEDHSLVESPIAPASPTMKIEAFAPADEFDYVRGVKQGWTRQIAFVKDPDPLAPNYFVLCDSLAKETSAVWRLWLTAEKVSVEGRRALVVGKEDVDMDILFLLPANVQLKTQEKSCSSHGMRADGRQMRMTTTQLGVIANVAKGRGFAAVLYPRLKEEKPATLTPIAGGKGVKVQSAAGTDYVFLSPAAFEFKDGGVAFSGTVGAAQMRGKRLVLSLGAAGSITAGGKTLEAKQAASKVFETE